MQKQWIKETKRYQRIKKLLNNMISKQKDNEKETDNIMKI